MQKKIFGLIVSLTLILSSFSSLSVFAATEQQLAVFSYTAPTEQITVMLLPHLKLLPIKN